MSTLPPPQLPAPSTTSAGNPGAPIKTAHEAGVTGGWGPAPGVPLPPGFPDPNTVPNPVGPPKDQLMQPLIESPFRFEPMDPPTGSTKPEYLPLNGKELGHILYVQSRRALETHFKFQPGLVYKEASFQLWLNLITPEQPPVETRLVDLDIMSRDGGEVLRKLVSRFEQSLVGHSAFQEGLAYPLVVARVAIVIDSSNDAIYTGGLTTLEIGPSDSPDRIRMAFRLPTQVQIPPGVLGDSDTPPPGEPLDSSPKERGPVVDVGDHITHPAWGGGAKYLVERVDDDGIHVRRPNESEVLKIGAGTTIWRELKVHPKRGKK